MTEQRHTRRHNAAWQAARQWQARARQARPSSAGGFRLFLTWLMLGVMMIVGTLLGLFFLLVGWLMMPIVRHRLKKHAEAVRAQHAQDIGGGYQAQSQPERHTSHQLLEGEYKIRPDSEK